MLLGVLRACRALDFVGLVLGWWLSCSALGTWVGVGGGEALGTRIGGVNVSEWGMFEGKVRTLGRPKVFYMM